MTTSNSGDIPQYKAAMKIIEELFLLDPAVVDTLDTPEGFLLHCIADGIHKYERKYWPMPGDDE